MPCLTFPKEQEMQNADVPRPGIRLLTSSPCGGFHSGWSFPAPPSTVVLMSSERLIRAVLATVDSWLEALDLIYDEATPDHRARVLRLKCSMLQSKVSFLRLVNASQGEIDAAYAQASRDIVRPAD
jgi:hypothetical protein